MASQAKIINAVNRCIKQLDNLEFRLNPGGICAGLAGLYIKYSLENKTTQFLAMLERLATLPLDYKWGSDAAIDDFIMQVERIFNARLYSHFEVKQEELEKTIHIQNQPLKNEFNLGLLTDAASWEKLITRIAREGRAYYVVNHEHAIALHYHEGKYYLYDPNSDDPPKALNSKEVVDQFKKSFRETETYLGLSIRVFAHPEAPPEHYPEPGVLPKLAFAQAKDKIPSIELEEQFLQSSTFASEVRDVDTLRYLMEEKRIHWDKAREEFFSPSFNQLLVEQPIFPGLREVLLQGISLSIATANLKQAQQLIEHYRTHYTSDVSLLESTIKNIFYSGMSQIVVRTKEEDYDDFLRLSSELQLSTNPPILPYYNHLKLLTLLYQKANEQEFTFFLNTLSLDQLITQIQTAAIANNTSLLNCLIRHLTVLGHPPQSLPSIFNEPVLQKISAQTLKRLLTQGFVIDLNQSELLSTCSLRQDKNIFEIFARAFSHQAQATQVWDFIDKNAYESLDLSYSIGTLSLLNVLVFLNKNEHIRQAWKNNIPPELIEHSLIAAILVGNVEMSMFLYEKLQEHHRSLLPETLEYLYDTGLKEKNLMLLNSLASTQYQVLHQVKHVYKILSLCHDNDDYTILDCCLEKASPPIQQLVLKIALNSPSLTKHLATSSPQLFNQWLNDWAKKETSKDRDKALARLNKHLDTLPAQTLNLQGDLTQLKQFVLYCFDKKLFKLSTCLMTSALWDEPELSQLLNHLIVTKNEGAIAHLILRHPSLQQPAQLIMLTRHRLLNTMEFLLDKLIIDESTCAQIAAVGIAANNKKLIKKMLTLGLLNAKTPFTPALSEKLKDIIDEGQTDVVECLIHSDVDFKLPFNALLLQSCQHAQLRLANQLLAKITTLSEQEQKSLSSTLFNQQPMKSILDMLYQKGYGRLYSLAVNSYEMDQASRDSLLLTPLQRAIHDKNEDLFNAFFQELPLPSPPSKILLTLLEDPISTPHYLPSFLTKYGLEVLLTEALQHQQWQVVANLIEKTVQADLSPEVFGQLQNNDESIVTAFLQNLQTHFAREDVRKRLFPLLLKETGVLANLASPFKNEVSQTLAIVEKKMLEQGLHLNGQIYRYALDMGGSSSALKQITRLLRQCNWLMEEEQINLDEPIKNSALLIYYSQIKNLMLIYDLLPQEKLLERLNNNSRLAPVHQCESLLYDLMKTCRLAEQPLAQQPPDIQNQITTHLDALQNVLAEAELPYSFLLPQVQSLLATYQQGYCLLNDSGEEEEVWLEDTSATANENKSLPLDDLNEQKHTLIHAIDEHLPNRNQTLSRLTYYFDYYRGEIVANHYKNLIEFSKNTEELHVITYAILTHPGEDALKENIAHALGWKNLPEALTKMKAEICNSQLRKYLESLDKVIEAIQKKVHNGSSNNATVELLSNELNGLRFLCSKKSTHTQGSLFQPEHKQQQIPVSDWISSLVRPSPNEHRLSFKKP